mgnify:FL=1
MFLLKFLLNYILHLKRHVKNQMLCILNTSYAIVVQAGLFVQLFTVEEVWSVPCAVALFYEDFAVLRSTIHLGMKFHTDERIFTYVGVSLHNFLDYNAKGSNLQPL